PYAYSWERDAVPHEPARRLRRARAPVRQLAVEPLRPPAEAAELGPPVRRPQPVLQRLPAARGQPAAPFRPLGGPEGVQVAPLDQVPDPSQILRRSLELAKPGTEAPV